MRPARIFPEQFQRSRRECHGGGEGQDFVLDAKRCDVFPPIGERAHDRVPGGVVRLRLQDYTFVAGLDSDHLLGEHEHAAFLHGVPPVRGTFKIRFDGFTLEM
jgi:hypothetical protein